MFCLHQDQNQRELDRISTLLVRYSPSSPVAVLGSTPEFRGSLRLFGFINIYIFHNNARFHRQVSELCPLAKNETIIEGDWLETISKYKNKFSVVLSDLTIGNIPYTDRVLFYNIIYDALNTDGCFIDKILCHPIEHISLEIIEREFCRPEINLHTINNFNCMALFCSDLLNIKQS